MGKGKIDCTLIKCMIALLATPEKDRVLKLVKSKKVKNNKRGVHKEDEQCEES